MNKIIIVIVIAAGIILGGYFLLRGKTPTRPNVKTPSVITPVEQNVVTYTDAGYSPSTLSVKTGTTVTFKNASSHSMWTASAVHPTHAAYPTTGGCLGSTFDTCSGIAPGGSWSFTFDIAGSWKYHNHLRPGDTGTIIVK